MKLIIGEYVGGRLQEHYNSVGDIITPSQLQELKGQFTKQFREENIKLTEQQLLDAATADQDIIQAVHSIENLDVILNSTGKYTTEWYELHHPEQETTWITLSERTLQERGLHELNETVKNMAQTRAVILAYIEERMEKTMPNVTAAAGGMIGAKLLAAAGSIDRFAKLPATTVQLLGAEQALFRHLKNRRNLPPKYGILFNHPLVQKAPYPVRGKIARMLANSIAMAAKIDYFKGEFRGDMLKEKIERQFHAITRT